MIPVFWQLDNFDSPQEVYSMAGAIYFTTVLQMFMNFLPTVIVFQAEKPVYVRDRASNLYDIWVYATTKLLAEIPIMLFVPMLLNCMLYFAVGYQDRFSEFLAFYLILALMVQAATAMGYFLSSLFNHETTAVAFSPIINLPMNLMGGYMINLKNIFQKTPQKYIAWVQFFSPVRYGFEGLMHAQFPVEGYPYTYQIFEDFGFHWNYWICVGGLTGIFIMFRLLTIFSLWLQDKNTKICGKS